MPYVATHSEKKKKTFLKTYHRKKILRQYVTAGATSKVRMATSGYADGTKIKQDRQYTQEVTLRSVRANIVQWKSNNKYTLCVCVCV